MPARNFVLLKLQVYDNLYVVAYSMTATE